MSFKMFHHIWFFTVNRAITRTCLKTSFKPTKQNLNSLWLTNSPVDWHFPWSVPVLSWLLVAGRGQRLRDRPRHSWRSVWGVKSHTGILAFPTELFANLFWIFHPTRELFTHKETSPLPVKGCKFLPILCTYDNWAVRDLQRATPVTTCFIDLGLSRSWIEPRSPTCETNALPQTDLKTQRPRWPSEITQID